MDLITNVADGLAQLATAVAPPLPELTDEAVIAILMQLPLSELPSCAAACSHRQVHQWTQHLLMQVRDPHWKDRVTQFER